jgi:hypothetical protein
MTDDTIVTFIQGNVFLRELCDTGSSEFSGMKEQDIAVALATTYHIFLSNTALDRP